MRVNWIMVAVLLGAHFFAVRWGFIANEKTNLLIQKYFCYCFRPFFRKLSRNLSLYLKATLILVSAAGLFL
jgi:hypothetical protein